MEITVLNNQSLFDLSLQVYGSAEGAFQLAFENSLSVTDELHTGQVLKYDLANVINKQVVDYYRVNGIKPATGLQDENEQNNYKIFDQTFDQTFE